MTIILKGHVKDLGDNFTVRRILPAMEKRFVGPFVFFDHFGPVPVVTGKELSVRPHPHIGLSTITFLYDGVINHKDSLGVEQPIRPFETNWMTAGSGIVHSERSLLDPEYKIIEGLQTWVALPKDKEEIDPSFQHLSQAEIPIYEQEGIIFRLLGGEFLGLKSKAHVHSPLFYADIEAKPSAGEVVWDLSEKQEAGLYVARGSVRVAGEDLDVGKMAIFPKGEKVRFQATQNSRLMLLGGEPLEEKRNLWWNFVSTSQERIEKAKSDWENDLFAKVPGETERIPLPPPPH
ncbi:pirin family protein [Leptospira idonii]|uniref:Pirin family protein n=1 Tax=Leptospira idonii TaxID=1193500 RepID=A0A4R9LVY8_9LEPT|nr:pirin family protein [Leptospira idonii]TGN17364.1 pirin family protein [Leptospira idonii]